MTYKQFLDKIHQSKRFRILQNQNDKNHFGNFYIEILFDETIHLQITQDRGIIEIEIMVSHAFSKDYIPLVFAVNFVDSLDKRLGNDYIFHNIMSTQEYLFLSIGSLEYIVKNNLIKVITNSWKKTNSLKV